MYIFACFAHCFFDRKLQLPTQRREHIAFVEWTAMFRNDHKINISCAVRYLNMQKIVNFLW